MPTYTASVRSRGTFTRAPTTSEAAISAAADDHREAHRDGPQGDRPEPLGGVGAVEVDVARVVDQVDAGRRQAERHERDRGHAQHLGLSESAGQHGRGEDQHVLQPVPRPGGADQLRGHGGACCQRVGHGERVVSSGVDPAVRTAREVVGLYGDPHATWGICLEAGLLEPLAVRDAERRLAALVAAHPSLGAAPACRLVTEGWEAARSRVASEPYGPSEPLLRVLVDADGSRLFVGAHHGAVDGLGLVAVAGAAAGLTVRARARGIGDRGPGTASSRPACAGWARPWSTPHRGSRPASPRCRRWSRTSGSTCSRMPTAARRTWPTRWWPRTRPGASLAATPCC